MTRNPRLVFVDEVSVIDAAADTSPPMNRVALVFALLMNDRQSVETERAKRRCRSARRPDCEDLLVALEDLTGNWVIESDRRLWHLDAVHRAYEFSGDVDGVAKDRVDSLG